MTLHKPLWGGATTYSATEDRQLINELFTAAGVMDFIGGDLKVVQRAAGANMSVDVGAGSAVVEGTDVAGQGRFLVSSSAVENRAGIVAPGAGTSRIDRIYARVLDADVLGGTSSWVLDRAIGTAAASPTVPALPASALALARFTVLNSTTSITNAMITDDRVPATYLARGLVVAEFGAGAQNIGNTVTAEKTLTSPTVRPSVYPASLFFSAGTPTRMLIPWTGLWSVHWGPSMSPAGGFGWTALLRKDADANSICGISAEGTASILGFGGMYLTAGQYLRFLVENNTGGTSSCSSAQHGYPRLMYHGVPA